MVDLELQLPEVEGIEIWLPKRRQTYREVLLPELVRSDGHREVHL